MRSNKYWYECDTLRIVENSILIVVNLGRIKFVKLDLRFTKDIYFICRMDGFKIKDYLEIVLCNRKNVNYLDFNLYFKSRSLS